MWIISKFCVSWNISLVLRTFNDLKIESPFLTYACIKTFGGLDLTLSSQWIISNLEDLSSLFTYFNKEALLILFSTLSRLRISCTFSLFMGKVFLFCKTFENSWPSPKAISLELLSNVGITPELSLLFQTCTQKERKETEHGGLSISGSQFLFL